MGYKSLNWGSSVENSTNSILSKSFTRVWGIGFRACRSGFRVCCMVRG